MCRLVDGIGLGFIRLDHADHDDDDDDEWTEEDEEAMEEFIHERDEWMRRFKEEAEEFDQQMERLDAHRERIMLMEENLEWRIRVGNSVWFGDLSELSAEEAKAEIQALDQQTIELYGGCFEDIGDCNFDKEFIDKFESYSCHQDIEEWWNEEYLPSYREMRRSVQEKEEDDWKGE